MFSNNNNYRPMIKKVDFFFLGSKIYKKNILNIWRFENMISDNIKKLINQGKKFIFFLLII